MNPIKRPVSKKRQKLIDAVNSSPIEVGQQVGIRDMHISTYTSKPDKVKECTVLGIDGDVLIVVESEYSNSNVGVDNVHTQCPNDSLGFMDDRVHMETY